MWPFRWRKPDSSQRIAAALAVMTRHIKANQQTLGALMAAQDDVNTATQVFSGVLTDVQAQTAALVTDLAAIQAAVAAGQPVSTSALNAVVASAQGMQAALDTAVGSISTSVTPPAPPAP